MSIPSTGATPSTQPNQPTAEQKAAHKAEFEAKVKAYMASHPGTTEPEAKAAIKAEHKGGVPQQQAAPAPSATPLTSTAPGQLFQ